jgi:hypothetical protein
MQVEDDVVSFSLLHLTKKTALNIAANPIVIPKGPLARLKKQAKTLSTGTVGAEAQIDEAGVVLVPAKPAMTPLAGNEIVVEMNETFYRLIYKTDDSGLVSLETAPDQEDSTFDLPPRGVQLSLYMKSPKIKHTIAVSFIGHLGKPGTPETVTRAAALVLNSISGLMEFRKVSGIEHAKLPAAPHKFAARPPARKSEDKVIFDLTVNMVTADFQPVASGAVLVEIDLDHANPSSGHLLYHFTPDPAIAEVFGEFRDMVVAAISATLAKELGDELPEITFEIVLGEVNSGTLERLRSAIKNLSAVDVTPQVYRVHEVVATS